MTGLRRFQLKTRRRAALAGVADNVANGFALNAHGRLIVCWQRHTFFCAADSSFEVSGKASASKQSNQTARGLAYLAPLTLNHSAGQFLLLNSPAFEASKSV